jgi:hypothetical protein
MASPAVNFIASSSISVMGNILVKNAHSFKSTNMDDELDVGHATFLVDESPHSQNRAAVTVRSGVSARRVRA